MLKRRGYDEFMSQIIDEILRRIEKLGYRIAMVTRGYALTIEALHPSTGQRFAVHGSANRSFAAVRELAEMMDVAYRDLLPSHRMPRFVLDDPEADEPGFRLAKVYLEG